MNTPDLDSNNPLIEAVDTAVRAVAIQLPAWEPGHRNSGT